MTAPRKARRPLRSGLLLLLMIVIAIVMLYPFWFMIDNSFKSQSAFIGRGGHSLDSWRALGSALPWGQQMKNSTIVCLLSIAITGAVEGGTQRIVAAPVRFLRECDEQDRIRRCHADGHDRAHERLNVQRRVGHERRDATPAMTAAPSPSR